MGDGERATHFYYKLETDKRVSLRGDADYEACCRDKGTCGYGFIAALVHAEGRYATASDSSSQGGLSIPLAGGADGPVRAKILHERKVHGYAVAVISRTDANAAPTSVSLLGDPTAVDSTPSESSLSDYARSRFESERIDVVAGDGENSAYIFKDGLGPVTEGAFFKRYHDVTGAADLDGAKNARGTGLMVAGGVVLAVGLAGAILLVSTSQSNSGCMQTPSGSFCPPPSSSGPDLAGGIAFSTAGLAGAALVAAGLADHQKGHAIARADAEIYAARYNRALLRKIGRETSQRLRRGESTLLRVPPAASPRSMGLSGLL